MTLVRVATREAVMPSGDAVVVWQWFLEMVNALPDVTVLGTLRHDFPGGGFSGLVLLGESHAAIHTWPEQGRAWCELATCGDPRALAAFETALAAWERGP